MVSMGKGLDRDKSAGSCIVDLSWETEEEQDFWHLVVVVPTGLIDVDATFIILVHSYSFNTDSCSFATGAGR